MSDVSYRWIVRIILLIVAGDILFTNGFMLLRIPPVGPGVPINQLLLAIAVTSILYSRQSLAGFGRATIFLPLSILWILGAVQLVVGLVLYGFWAIRDAANVIETGFLFVGYCIASDRRFPTIFAVWFRRVVTFAAFYILLYPAQGFLARFSPVVASISGYQLPLFFNFGNPASVGVTASCYMLLSSRGSSILRLLLAASLIMTLIVFVQARIAYLQLLFLFLLIAAFRPARLSNIGLMGILAVSFVGLFLASGIELPGRLGQSFTLDFLVNHIQAIWGGGGHETRAAAEGVDLRLNWWEEIHVNLTQSLSTWFTGLGYGMPLTSFRGPDDDIVREPHNSFVSIYGRLGVVGIIAFLTMQLLILKSAVRLIYNTRAFGFATMNNIVVTITCFIGVHLIYSMGEGGFEVSFIAVPYYFFSGVILAFDRLSIISFSQAQCGGARPQANPNNLVVP